MVKIEKLKEGKEKIIFLIKDTNYSFMNAIRRSVFEVPVLAIDEVEFFKNDSALYDEVLAHRLGLIPLKAGKDFTSKAECSCKGKGCLKCTASCKLKAKGPCTVYSGDLKTKGFEPVYSDMPLVILAKDQELEFTADAVLGRALEHTKFSSGFVWFNAYPMINLTKETETYTDLATVCPKKAITIKGNKIEIDPLKCDVCEACIEECSKNDKKPIDIKYSEKDFIVYIESFGQLDAKEIFTEALSALNSNLKELAKELK